MSVQKRTRGGRTRWVARYRSTTGREYSKTFDTKREAAAWVADRERDVRRGEWVDPNAGKATVGEIMAAYTQAAARPNTAATRRTTTGNLGPLAEMPIAHLTAADVEAWVGQLTRGRPWAAGKPVAASTADTMLRVLRAALGVAVRDGRIYRNPATGVRVPDTGARTILPRDIPTTGQVQAMITTAGNYHPGLGLLLRTMAETGLRPSEAAGLSPADLDAAGSSIHVTVQVDGHGRRVALKTTASQRRVMVTRVLMDALVAAGAKHAEALFLTPTGLPMTRQRAAGLAVSAGVGWPLHSLRHYHATQLLRAGVPIKTVQARLGHATAALTLETYAHAVPGDDALAAGVVAGLLGPGAGLRMAE